MSQRAETKAGGPASVGDVDRLGKTCIIRSEGAYGGGVVSAEYIGLWGVYASA